MFHQLYGEDTTQYGDRCQYRLSYECNVNCCDTLTNPTDKSQ